ncbi:MULTISPECIES: hypothetical protein [Ferrimonas]|uniref:hypothetical protein n=1 Tax=Ferrimonas TaxID=44011 RepID=UPI000487348B|nr:MULTISPECIES: hypothetical protein [Ferrimonas]USD35840.1 hypothetical protein J8Z22_12375 [Ferrimonas sp. SCSIO 43195]
MRKLFISMFFVMLLSGCDLDVAIPVPNKIFGTQNFVSAVSIIELHKVRNGSYPSNLDELEFLGQWDSIWLSAVRYEKTNNGYNLFVERGWVGKPNLTFPEKFKQGLGIEKTNVTWIEP